MIQVNFMKPFYTKVTGTKLRLVFAYQYFGVSKDNEVYHFIPIESKEIIIDLRTTQVENLSDVFVFQRGDKFLRLPMYQLLLISNIHDYLMPIINEANLDNNTKIPEETISIIKVAKVNFKGFGEPKSRYKTYYFKTYLDNLKKGDIVIVDSNGERQNANFLGYIDKSTLTIEPTKFIIKKSDIKVEVEEVNKKINMRTSEYRGTYNVRKETNSLMAEIMAFHKDNYIDKCLEQGNYEDIHGVL